MAHEAPTPWLRIINRDLLSCPYTRGPGSRNAISFLSLKIPAWNCRIARGLRNTWTEKKNLNRKKRQAEGDPATVEPPKSKETLLNILQETWKKKQKKNYEVSSDLFEASLSTRSRYLTVFREVLSLRGSQDDYNDSTSAKGSPSPVVYFLSL